MKTTKKILALVMAVAFVFSLCVFSASAYNNGNVYVEIQMYGEEAWHITLSQQDIEDWIGYDTNPESPYTASAYHVYYVPSGVTHTTALTAADALLAAYNEKYPTPYGATQVHYSWYPNNGIYGIYFDCYEGLEPDPVGVYYLVDSWYEDDEWHYEYIWEGEAWLLSINGVSTSMYASAYQLGTAYTEFNNEQPQNIVLNYDYAQEDFVTTTYIEGAIPLY